MASEAVRLIPVKTPEPSRCASISPAIVDAILISPPVHAHQGAPASFCPPGHASRKMICSRRTPIKPET